MRIVRVLSLGLSDVHHSHTVTPFNIEYLQSLVNNGPSQYPGAKFVIRESKERIDLKYRLSSEQLDLQYGWTVERHLKNGE